MKRRWFIYLIIGIIMITGGCLGYLQFGRDMDVYGSYAMTADNYHEERLIVVLNKLYVAQRRESRCLHFLTCRRIVMERIVL